jgi:hypothetical protein
MYDSNAAAAAVMNVSPVSCLNTCSKHQHDGQTHLNVTATPAWSAGITVLIWHRGLTTTPGFNKSINVAYVAMIFIENSCQPFIENHLFGLSTFSTSPSKTTIQIATDGNLGHPHLLLAGSAKAWVSILQPKPLQRKPNSTGTDRKQRSREGTKEY